MSDVLERMAESLSEQYGDNADYPADPMVEHRVQARRVLRAALETQMDSLGPAAMNGVDQSMAWENLVDAAYVEDGDE